MLAGRKDRHQELVENKQPIGPVYEKKKPSDGVFTRTGAAKLNQPLASQGDPLDPSLRQQHDAILEQQQKSTDTQRQLSTGADALGRGIYAAASDNELFMGAMSLAEGMEVSTRQAQEYARSTHRSTHPSTVFHAKPGRRTAIQVPQGAIVSSMLLETNRREVEKDTEQRKAKVQRNVKATGGARGNETTFTLDEYSNQLFRDFSHECAESTKKAQQNEQTRHKVATAGLGRDAFVRANSLT